MNILITGRKGLARSLGSLLEHSHTVTYVSVSQGQDLAHVADWGPGFYHYDMLINCAYHKWDQVQVLEQFFWAWHQDPTKTIVNIGSTISDYARFHRDLDHEYMDYRVHKQALQLAFVKLSKQGECDIKLINPGAMDTDMLKNVTMANKMSPDLVAAKILQWIFDPVVKRIDLWQ